MVTTARIPALFLRFLIWTALVLLPMLATANALKSLVMPGELILGHAKYEQHCHKCHDQPTQTVPNALCLACHEEQAEDIETGKGFHGHLKNMEDRKCKGCHGEHKGRRFDIMGLDKETFDHRNTDFLLKGEHSKVECSRCHLDKKKIPRGLTPMRGLPQGRRTP
jgi:Zn finger protein HypA/HybF involved in hydrogenase expression